MSYYESTTFWDTIRALYHDQYCAATWARSWNWTSEHLKPFYNKQWGRRHCPPKSQNVRYERHIQQYLSDALAARWNSYQKNVKQLLVICREYGLRASSSRKCDLIAEILKFSSNKDTWGCVLLCCSGLRLRMLIRVYQQLEGAYNQWPKGTQRHSQCGRKGQETLVFASTSSSIASRGR